MKESNIGAAVFVKVDDYKEIRNLVETLKSKLREAKSTLERVESLRTRESQELNNWRSTLEEVENRIRGIDSNLLDPQI